MANVGVERVTYSVQGSHCIKLDMQLDGYEVQPRLVSLRLYLSDCEQKWLGDLHFAHVAAIYLVPSVSKLFKLQLNASR